MSGWLSVDSSPRKAELFIKEPGSAEYKSLGVAPLNKKMSEIRGILGNAKTVVLEARMPGYITRSMVITDVDSSSDLHISFELSNLEKSVKDGSADYAEASKKLLTETNEKHLVETNVIVDQLFEAQRLAQVGRLDDASKRLDEMQRIYPNVAAIYEMQGGIAFMQADYNKALDSYTLAAKNNPANLELINMRAFLERKLNLEKRKPAGQN